MSLLKKGSKLYSILKLKCPKCHEGDLFLSKTFSFKTPFQMHQNCSKCRQKYFLEPGFYYGAMFISYGITGIFSLSFVTICILLGVGVNASFLLLILACAILLVWFFRTARAIWININVKYDAQAIEKAKEQEVITEETTTFVNRNF